MTTNYIQSIEQGLNLYHSKQYAECIDKFNCSYSYLMNNEDNISHKNLEKILFSFARAYDKTNHYSKAIPIYEKLISLNNSNAIYYLNKGIALFHTKQYEESIVSFDKGIEIQNSLSSLYLNKGVSLNNLKKYELAIETFDIGLSQNPKDSSCYLNKGVSYFKL